MILISFKSNLLFDTHHIIWNAYHITWIIHGYQCIKRVHYLVYLQHATSCLTNDYYNNNIKVHIWWYDLISYKLLYKLCLSLSTDQLFCSTTTRQSRNCKRYIPFLQDYYLLLHWYFFVLDMTAVLLPLDIHASTISHPLHYRHYLTVCNFIKRDTRPLV